MEKEAIKSLLEIIDQQISSSILGGMEEEYEELESMGLIKIDRHRVQHSASITPEGLDYLEHLNNS
ncbi:hypothetical protein ABDJ41_22545 [Pedobacter sp. ASV1-7]|uniref:hypothetical protein n=1 Tax=Pedobacter sp. ASV1-7 TaxID=3145237 RepID=UPI0032E904CA